MKKTGQLLKDKRESANLSLSEVALATKINPKILTAIENGDETALPAKTFLKGFVRSYALFLKMDVDEVLRSFQEETGGKPVERIHEAYKTDATPAAAGSSRRRVGEENSSGMRTAAVVVIVLLIGLIIGVRELIEKYQREKVVASTESLKVSPLQQPPLVPEPVPVPEASAVLSNNSAAIPVPPVVSEVKPAEVKVPEPKPEVKPPEPKPKEEKAVALKPVEKKPEPPPPVAPPVPTPAPVAVAAPTPTPTSTPTPAPAAEPAKEPGKAVKNEIILEALDKVEIKMLIKGETKQLSLNPNQVHTVHSDQPVAFDFSDGGAVNIIVNGHERGVPGDLGKPKQITLP